MRSTYTKKYNFSSNNNIALIAWDVDFLEEIELLAQSLCKEHARFCTNSHENFETSASNKHNVVLVFPHGRPRRYLEDRYKKMAKKAGKAHILPRIIRGSDFLSLCLSHWERGKIPHTELKPLDRIALLHEAVIRVAKDLPESAVLRRLVDIADDEKRAHYDEKKMHYDEKKSRSDKKKTSKESESLLILNEDESMYAHEAMDKKSLSMAKFFPWAHSLDALFEECFQQLVDVIDIDHAEGEVSAFAAALLSGLRSIHVEYMDLLKSDTLTDNVNNEFDVSMYRASTPAFSAYRAAQFVEAYNAYMSAKEKGLGFGASRKNLGSQKPTNERSANENSTNENLKNERCDSIGVSSWNEDEQSIFFDNFMPEVFRDKIIIFAGFVRLTEAEDTLYKYFWKQGANVVWHSDPALDDTLHAPTDIFADSPDFSNTSNATSLNILADSLTDSPADTSVNASADISAETSLSDKILEKPPQEHVGNLRNKIHYSCVDHLEWLQKWNTHCTLLCEPKWKKPKIHFYAAYDAHSQVQALKSDLEKCVEALSKEINTQKYDEDVMRDSKSSNEFSIEGSAARKSTSKELLLSALKEESSHLLHNQNDNVLGQNTLDQDETRKFYNSASDDTLAILLPKASLLMPVLHELPEKNINISMGYPVSRTLLGQFIELIMRLQENKQIKPKGEIYVSVMNRHGQMGRDTASDTAVTTSTHAMNDAAAGTTENRTWYTWKDILSLLRHPYARMLVPYDSSLAENPLEDENSFREENELNKENVSSKENERNKEDEQGKQNNKGEDFIDREAAEKQKTAWRNLLFTLEKSLRKGNVSLNIDDFLDEILGDIDAEDFDISDDLANFISKFFEHSISVWERVESLYDVAHALEDFADFLLKHGSVLWQSFPLDAEALVRCVEKVVPALRDSSLAHDYLPPEALFTVFRQLFAEERIPFEADPLSGMQILGMLESRLLRFRKVFIMDMTEDNLPGIIQQDPLMPDSLRNLLSLPDTHKREILTAHTFYRLIAGAEDVWLYWQEGIQSSEVQSSKSLRSRFVEECLWEEEKKKGQIVQNGDAFLRSADCRPIAPLRQSKKHIPCTEAVKDKLRSFFEKCISASALDTYIHCPAKFFYTYLGKLGEIDEVSEGDDSRKLGIWLHQLLQDTYEDFVGQSFEHNQKNLNILLELFHTRLNSPEVSNFISPESYFMLTRAGEFHLKKYWESMPCIVKPMSLEKKYECDVPSALFADNPLGVSKIKLQGKFDRVDIRLSQNILQNALQNVVQNDDDISHEIKSEYSNLTPQQKLKIDKMFKDAEDEFSRSSFSHMPNEEHGFCLESPLHGVEHWILDYKTGKGQKLNKKIWENNALWNAIKEANQTKTQGRRDDILQEISLLMPNIQLPFYLYIYGRNFPQVLCNAGWIFLGEEKKEIPLVEIQTPKKPSLKTAQESTPSVPSTPSEPNLGEENNLASWKLLHTIKTQLMPELLEFSLNHLLQAQSFKTIEGKSCSYCPHKGYC